MYYSAAFTVLGGLHTTPLRSLASKMVERTEYGKIFTVIGVVVAMAQLISNSVMSEVYADTVASDPGFLYFLAAGFAAFALVIEIAFLCSTKKHAKDLFCFLRFLFAYYMLLCLTMKGSMES